MYNRVDIQLKNNEFLLSGGVDSNNGTPLMTINSMYEQ